MPVTEADTDVYLADFDRSEKELARVGSLALHRLRKAAISRFAELGFPGPRDEEWRFTPIGSLAAIPFETARVEGEGLIPPSGLALPPGVLLLSLADALRQHAHLVEPHLARHADYKNSSFTALNTAFLQDGVFLYVPPGVVVEEPITLRFQAPASERPLLWQRRTLVVVGAGSQVRVVEEYDGPADIRYFTNAVTEVVLGPGAVAEHYKLQREGSEAFHIATLQVQQERGSNFTSHSIALGGSLVRTDINAVLGAEGCECTLNGLYLASGQQLIDNHTFIDHAQPHCASHELYKGILDGKARGVFNGKILVRQDAQKTDAKQTNQVLLLSEDATINTKPQLEIYADDVKCTHGATVGQLDADAIFYLRARGVGLAEARSLLTFAFANEVVSRIRIPAIRRHLEQTLLASQNLPRVEAEEEP